MINIYLKGNRNVKIKMNSRNKILKELYSAYLDEYENYSLILKEALEKYKDVPLREYKPTKADLERLEEDPSYAENIPEYYVPGYDSFIGEKYPIAARNEFVERFKKGDPKIAEFINKYNDFYVAEVV